MGTHKDTLLLPKTTLPIGANLPANEPTRYAAWEEGKVYERMKRDGRDPFILHDGPPYANGDIHIGHALNKILKDFAVKVQFFNGRAVEFVPGWDCHGLPIEQKVKQLYPEVQVGSNPLHLRLREKCRAYAETQVESQKAQFKKLGVIADWENPYKTMDPAYEDMIFRRLCELREKGLIEQRSKPVYWSWAEKTALSEAEIEYKDRKDTSIYLVFPSEYETFPGGFLVWTTTPWTLPANVAVAIHPDIDYTAAKVAGYDYPVVIQDSLFDTLKEKGIAEERRGPVFKGRDMKGWKVKHPIYDTVVPIIMGEFVKKVQHGSLGTGCVHIAPGHGEEDYQAGIEHGLPTVMPVGPDGIYAEGKYAGSFVFDANKTIIEDLKASGRLVKEEVIDHSYPHCWRSGTPIIYRATPQIFLKLDELRAVVTAEIDKVEFYPENSKNRMRPMLALRPDWCLSRQRVWGVPIAFLRNKETGHLMTNPQVLEYTREVLSREGMNAWGRPESNFIDGPDALRPSHFVPYEGEYHVHCNAINPHYEKLEDILDVWFDSGLSWNTLNGRQADLYLEGNDQHRGWFQSSLWLSVALTGKAPYKKVVTHGFITDGQGGKMSKQKGNVVNPNEAIQRYGAEVLRYWVASSDYTRDATISPEIMQRAVEGHKKLRNTFRFLLANIGDTLPGMKGDFLVVDKWILDKARVVFAEVHQSFEDYEYYKGLHKLTDFVNGDLNSVYFNSIKDTLYCDDKDGYPRTSVVMALTTLLEGMLSLVAPLFTYTADEVFSHAPAWFRDGRKDIFDVKYRPMPFLPDREDKLDDAFWKEVLTKFHAEFDKAKTAGLVKDTLEARLERVSGRAFFPRAEDWFVVGAVADDPSPDEALAVFDADGSQYRIVKSKMNKCERCWKRNAEGDLCARCQSVVYNPPNPG